jgi:hypothetical protein
MCSASGILTDSDVTIKQLHMTMRIAAEQQQQQQQQQLEDLFPAALLLTFLAPCRCIL